MSVLATVRLEPVGEAPPSADLERRVERFLYAYARAIDEDRLEDWPGFFGDPCLYRVVPRENADRTMPLPLVSATSQGMLQDRVKSLREANIYNLHYPRHVVSNMEVSLGADGLVLATSNVVVFQTDMDGRTSLFCVGQYRDRIEDDGERLSFAERTVIIDTYNIPNLLAVPI